ncbi:MAG: hypothetical protein JXR91_07955 [Deltaproteobacteria bacterium]|nr:hypothetical protein [Deltaproteobacteria bacterium]
MSSKSDKIPFYKKPADIITIILIIIMGLFLSIYKFENTNQTGFQQIFSSGRKLFVRATAGCSKPPDREIEAYYNDKAGSVPIDPSFDADKDEICGNGRKYYCTSLPPDKPVPLTWNKPPLPGEDPTYEGPSPFDVFKESPHSMPSSKSVLRRNQIKDLEDRDLIYYMKKSMGDSNSKIALVNSNNLSSQLEPLKNKIEILKDIDIWSTDDKPVAEDLEKRGIDFVLYDRSTPKAKQWMEEKYNTVALRMRDALPMGYFSPAVIGSRWILYKRTVPFKIPTYVKRRITTRIRATLSTGASGDLAFTPARKLDNGEQYAVIVSLRKRNSPEVKGRKIIKKIGRASTFDGAIDRAALKILEQWTNGVEKAKTSFGITLNSDLSKEIDNMEIEVDVLYNETYLSDRTPSNLLWYVELGLEGVMLEKRDKPFSLDYLEPSYAVQMEITSEVQFLEKMLQKSNLSSFLKEPDNKKLKKTRGTVLSDSSFIRDSLYDFKRFSTVNWIERPKKQNHSIVEIYRGVPLKTIWDVSYSSLLRSLKLGAGWLMNNQTPDGQYRYKYIPTNVPGKRWTPGGNIVRHALNPYTLLMVNKLEQNPDYVKSAEKGIDFTLKFLRHEGDRCAVCHRDPPARYYNAKLNSVAVTILSILKLGDVADISKYKDDLKCMAEELLYMQDKNGHFRQYDVPYDHPYYGAESTIHAGEFIFALSRLYQYYKDEKFKDACDKSINYYMQQWDRTANNKTEDGIYNEEDRVNLIGIIPWLATAMEALHKMTGDNRYADLAFKVQDWIDDEFFWWQNRTQYPDYSGSSFKVHKELPAVNSCQYTEGAAATYAIAKRVNHDVEKRRKLVVLSMRFCLQLQFDGYDSTFFLPEPKEAMGGYRYTLGHLRVRNDYNYHAMAAIAQGAEYLEPYDYPEERPIHIEPMLSELLDNRDNPEKDMTLEEYKALKAQKELEAKQALPPAELITEQGINTRPEKQ